MANHLPARFETKHNKLLLANQAELARWVAGHAPREYLATTFALAEDLSCVPNISKTEVIPNGLFLSGKCENNLMHVTVVIRDDYSTIRAIRVFGRGRLAIAKPVDDQGYFMSYEIADPRERATRIEAQRSGGSTS
ncbi:MAG: hypothetical protein AAGA68_03930 [Pseudomonadota bacterium]